MSEELLPRATKVMLDLGNLLGKAARGVPIEVDSTLITVIRDAEKIIDELITQNMISRVYLA